MPFIYIGELCKVSRLFHASPYLEIMFLARLASTSLDTSSTRCGTYASKDAFMVPEVNKRNDGTGLMWAVWAWEEGGGELDCWERQLLKGYICNRESGKRL